MGGQQWKNCLSRSNSQPKKKGSRVSMTPTKMKTQMVKKGYNKCSRANLICRDLILKGSRSPFWSKSLTYFNITLHLPSLALTTRLAKTSIVPCVPGFWFIPTKTQHTRLVFASTKLQRKFDGSNVWISEFSLLSNTFVAFMIRKVKSPWMLAIE